MQFESDLFEDIAFLDDYILQSTLLTNVPVKAIIKGSSQKVIIHKIKMQQRIIQRFKTLVELFNEGIVLADTIFLVQENIDVFGYIVSVDLENGQKFQSLKQFVNRSVFGSSPNQSSKSNFEIEEELIVMVKKLMKLIQLVHQKGQNILNFKIQTIIVDIHKNVYLSPYILDQSVYLQTTKTQQLPYQRCNLSPQLISQLFQKIQTNARLKINKKMLIKNDYWSLGCLILQTFVFYTPPFLCIDVINQQQKYMMLDQLLNQWIVHIPTVLQGLLLNCLQKTIENRNINLQNEKLKQKLNSQLIIQLIKITKPIFKQQLEIGVNLSSKFTFYIEPKQYQNNQYQNQIMINKTITLKDTQEQLEKVITSPIKITFKQRSVKSEIEVNVGILGLKQEGIRICRQPIISSYSIPGTKSRLKIKFQYISPMQIILPKQVKHLNIQNVQHQILKQIKLLKDKQNKIIVKQLSKQKHRNNQDSQNSNYITLQNNQSINQINQYLDQLKQQFSKDSTKINK